MSGIKLFQNADSVQEFVHQRIDRDHSETPRSASLNCPRQNTMPKNGRPQCKR
jgi:hypothetical protein